MSLGLRVSDDTVSDSWPRGFFASHSLFSCNWSVYVCGCACCLFNRDGVSCQCGGVNLLHSHFQTVFVFCTCCCLMFELTLVFYLFLTLNLSFYDMLTQMYHGNSPCGVFWDSRLCRVSQSKLMPANGTDLEVSPEPWKRSLDRKQGPWEPEGELLISRPWVHSAPQETTDWATDKSV